MSQPDAQVFPSEDDLLRHIRDQSSMVPRTSPVVYIIPPLTHVRCDSSIPMLVVRSRISANNVVDYYCEWWVDGQLHTSWFDAARLEVGNGEKVAVGYRT